MSSIHVVIVNYRTAELTIDCLKTVALERREFINGTISVTVADSLSSDGSVEKIAASIRSEGWDDWCSVMPLAHNGGFAAGNNAVIRPIMAGPSPPDYFWLLNPDTLVRPGALKELIQFLEANPTVGIAGSRLEDPDGTPQRSAFRFPGIASEFESAVRMGPVSRLLSRKLVAPPIREDNHRTDWVAGASMLVRRTLFEKVGLLDEQYFLYYEETDFCLRASRKGWSCWYVPSSRVVHLVGQSSGVTRTNNVRQRRPAYWFESRRGYFRQNHGVVYAFIADIAWLTGYFGWRVRSFIQRIPDDLPEFLLGDFIRHNFR